jgi:hypothetical protein
VSAHKARISASCSNESADGPVETLEQIEKDESLVWERLTMISPPASSTA